MARDAGFFVVPVAGGTVRVCDGVLEVGPDASPDAIATIACRQQLHEIGVFDEASARELVESLGYAYVTQRSTGSSGVRYRAVC